MDSGTWTNLLCWQICIKAMLSWTLQWEGQGRVGGAVMGGGMNYDGCSHGHTGVHCQVVLCDEGPLQGLLWSESGRRPQPQQAREEGDKLLPVHSLRHSLNCVQSRVQGHQSQVRQSVKLVPASLLGRCAILAFVLCRGLGWGGKVAR